MESIEAQRFHDDLRAALLAGVPMPDSNGSSMTWRRLQQLDPNEGAVAAEGVEAEASDRVPRWYPAARTIFVRTGTLLPVLEGLSVQSNAIRAANRALRWTFFYLLILGAVGLLGLCLFEATCYESVEAFREDLKLAPGIIRERSFDGLQWLPVIIIGLAILVGVGLVGLLLIGTRRLSLWIGGNRFVRYTVSSMILRIAQSLVHSGLPVRESVSLACDVTHANDSLRMDVTRLIGETSPDDESNDESNEGHDADKADVSTRDQKKGADTIEKMANCQSHAAHQTLAQLKIAAPLVLVSLLGGTLALIYCMAVFLPIVTLLQDMSSLGM